MDRPQSRDASTPLLCTNCECPNPTGQRFCGNCGSALSSGPESIAFIVNQQVRRELDARLKDQKVVAVEIAESVYDRVSKWAKVFVVLLTLPLGAAVYFIYGQYASLSDLVKTSRSEAQRILAGATAEANNVKSSVETATKKTDGLNALLEGQSKSLDALDSKITGAQGKLADYESRMQGYEARISKSGTELLSQFETLKQNSNTQLKDIAALQERVSQQEKELTATGALVKDFASRSALEGFKAGTTASDSFVTITRTGSSHVIAMRLSKVPYPQTVRVQWNLAVQPPDGYFTNGNVVILPYWEDSIERLAERQMFVSYLADPNPPPGTPFYKVISVKNDAVYGDDKVLLPPLPPRQH
jgi:hypothetical protein